MWKKMLGALWRHAPRRLRRWGVRLIEPRFTVTAGAVVQDEEGRVLLLHHRFRSGSGWGIPGGFIEKGEQPEAALRRELREEIGLEIESAAIVFARTLARAGQIEIIFRCRAHGEVASRSAEIRSAGWFKPADFPPELSRDQRELIRRALKDGVNRTD